MSNARLLNPTTTKTPVLNSSRDPIIAPKGAQIALACVVAIEDDADMALLTRMPEVTSSPSLSARAVFELDSHAYGITRETVGTGVLDGVTNTHTVWGLTLVVPDDVDTGMVQGTVSNPTGGAVLPFWVLIVDPSQFNRIGTEPVSITAVSGGSGDIDARLERIETELTGIGKAFDALIAKMNDSDNVKDMADSVKDMADSVKEMVDGR